MPLNFLGTYVGSADHNTHLLLLNPQTKELGRNVSSLVVCTY
jgi:hypothetical protein